MLRRQNSLRTINSENFGLVFDYPKFREFLLNIFQSRNAGLKTVAGGGGEGVLIASRGGEINACSIL